MAGLENIPDQMLACQVVEFKQPYKIHHVPVPKDLQPHDLLIKTAVASLCHTDNMVREGIFQPKLPSTASHEGAGTVAAMGSAVTDFHIGDRVMAGLYLHACGVCDDCKVDLPQYCQKSEGAIGVNTQGCFAEYVRIDARTAAKLPDAVTFGTAAPLACAGCTIFRAIKQAGVKKGEWLGLVGAGGGLGHLGIQFAKALGVKVLGVDARDEGLALARKTGADVVLDARKGKEAVVEAAQQATGGEGVHATVNISEASSAAATSCAITRRHGLMVQIAQVRSASPLPSKLSRTEPPNPQYCPAARPSQRALLRAHLPGHQDPQLAGQLAHRGARDAASRGRARRPRRQEPRPRLAGHPAAPRPGSFRQHVRQGHRHCRPGSD
ncbi:chaperonin 10-like protein [Phyllosticta paracitricarpa]